MKRLGCILILLTGIAHGVFAQTTSRITKVGYVDIDVIVKMLQREPQIYRALSGQMDKTADQIAALTKEITELEARLKDEEAQEKQNERKKKQLADEIVVAYEKVEELEREQTLQKMESADIDNIALPVRQAIYGAVRVIARREGYSMILERYISGVIFVSPDVDITSKVNEEIRRAATEKISGSKR